MNEFQPYDFDSMNETDVREEVIALLLRRLGYRSSTRYNVIRELPLKYPQAHLGRKKPGSDPKLRGIADYILEVDGLVRWVVEAKSPAAMIGEDDIAQAWTYANHSEVRAVYFVLCNGETLLIFETQHGPKTPAILSLQYEELEPKFYAVAELLDPKRLLERFPRAEPDLSPPLGPGLRSVVRITGGWLRYKLQDPSHPLNHIQISVSGGSAERNDAGLVTARLETTSSIIEFQEFTDRLGLSSFDMVSNDSVLATDSSVPTQFIGDQTVILPQGEVLLDIANWSHQTLPMNMTIDSRTVAEGVLGDRIFSGRFVTTMTIREMNYTMPLDGVFEVHLA
jgi:hypothetical protein